MSRSGRPPAPPDPPEATRPAPARLVLARHAQSTWNGLGKIQGQLDPPLSERGREQAERLAERLAGRRFTAFFCSDLARCRETAAPIAQRLGREPVALSELREIYLGEWEGLTRHDLEARYPELWQRWLLQPDWDIVPGGEGAAAFESRVDAIVKRLVDDHPDGDVLVVTHGGVIQVALGHAVGRSSDGLFPFRIGNASLTTIEHGRKRLVIGSVNDVCHLEAPTGAGAGATALSL
jgi:broad specificity phosphatase PhoE